MLGEIVVRLPYIIFRRCAASLWEPALPAINRRFSADLPGLIAGKAGSHRGEKGRHEKGDPKVAFFSTAG
ncbi:hypothetical protein M5G11_14325 [Pseudomonas sp. TNT2022 ID681]|uniref:Uncharacterized protein n=1 Tax=Pseudomonas fontis TaxID=2942633 RepID=A0ABT5NU60_9PSED|nr:hypothetical protein [Pseudomonas fontis]